MDGMNAGLSALLRTQTKVALSLGVQNRLWGGLAGGVLGGAFGARVHQEMDAPDKKFWKYTGIGAGIGGLGGAAVGMNLLGRGLTAADDVKRYNAERAKVRAAEDAAEAAYAATPAAKARYKAEMRNAETAARAARVRNDPPLDEEFWGHTPQHENARRPTETREDPVAEVAEYVRKARERGGEDAARVRERLREMEAAYERMRAAQERFRNVGDAYGRGPRPVRPSTPSAPKGPWSTATTKADAKNAFRAAARTSHPDVPGGSLEKMKTLNADWDAFQQHSDFAKLGFELAMAQLGLGS